MVSHGHGQVVSWYVCTIATVPFVALRMWMRWKRAGRFGIDDYLVVLSLLCLIGDLAIQQHMWNLGLSQIPSISPENFKGIMQMIIPGSTLYVTSLWAIKFALVFFYKSLAAPGSRLVTVYNVALGGLAVMYLIIFFDILFQCYPHDKRWSSDLTYQCSPRAAEINYWITIFFNIFTDIIIIALPITMVSRLQMKLKQKLGVAGIFALGFLVVIASCIRAYYSKRNETMLTCTVSMIETAIAIIATCLPALRSTLLGANTTKGSSSGYGGRHYELSSTRRKASENRVNSKLNSSHQTSSTGGLQSHARANGSEGSLFSNESLNAAEMGTAGTAVQGICVNTQIETTFEEGRRDSSSPNIRSPFA